MTATERESISNNVGRSIRKYRLQAGLTQTALAKKAKLSTSYVSFLERGERLAPLDTLFDIARALKVPAAVLVP